MNHPIVTVRRNIEIYRKKLNWNLMNNPYSKYISYRMNNLSKMYESAFIYEWTMFCFYSKNTIVIKHLFQHFNLKPNGDKYFVNIPHSDSFKWAIYNPEQYTISSANSIIYFSLLIWCFIIPISDLQLPHV